MSGGFPPWGRGSGRNPHRSEFVPFFSRAIYSYICLVETHFLKFTFILLLYNLGTFLNYCFLNIKKGLNSPSPVLQWNTHCNNLKPLSLFIFEMDTFHLFPVVMSFPWYTTVHQQCWFITKLSIWSDKFSAIDFECFTHIHARGGSWVKICSGFLYYFRETHRLRF